MYGSSASNDYAYVMQIPSSQPLLVLATCKCSPWELPPVLLNFFATTSGALPKAPAEQAGLDRASHQSNSSGAQPKAQIEQAHLNRTSNQISSPDAVEQDVKAGEAAMLNKASNYKSSSVIVLSSEARSQYSWDAAVTRSAQAAANAVAVSAVEQLQQHLTGIAADGGSRNAELHNSLTDAALLNGNQGDSRQLKGLSKQQPSGHNRQGSNGLNGQLPTGGNGLNGQLPTRHNEQHDCNGSGQQGGGIENQAALGNLVGKRQRLSGHKRQLENGLERQAGNGNKRQTVVNAHDLQQGLKLYGEVSSSNVVCCW